MGPKPDITIRAARPVDVAVIHSFILALATFERCPEKVLATTSSLAETLGLQEISFIERSEEATLKSTALGEGQFAKCIIAERGGEAAGFAIFFYNYSTWIGGPGIYLEDLFTSPSHRSAGVGTALLSWLSRHALGIGAKRLDWSVLKWNVGAKNFYRETCGAEMLDEWESCRVEGEDKLELLAQLS